MDIPSPYLRHVEECFPDLAIGSVSLNRDGLVNDVVVVNDEIVFRFPKNEVARRSLAKEAGLLDLVRRYVAMPVPRFERQAADFVVYRRIPGRALQRDDILLQAAPVQDRLAEQLATFLRQLHTIPNDVIQQHAIPPSDAVRGRADWIRLFYEVERELFPYLMTHAKEWVVRHFEHVLDGGLDLTYAPALTHGDLGPYHILYDSLAHAINGVIDFGTAGLGDPADDFANVIHALGEPFLQRMSKFYPEIVAALDRARFWAGTLELQWALIGLRSGDPSWLVCHIGSARDVMPIGARWG